MTSERMGEVVVSRTPGVVWATLDRPEARNAINEGIISGLDAAVDVAIADEARVLAIRGAGGNFCAGADLQYVSGLLESDPAGMESYVARIAAVLRRFETAPFATVAAIEGYALAGGCETLLACDIVLATTTARIGDRHLEFGLLPGAGASVRMPRTLPTARGSYLLLTGEMIDGAEAAAWGLITRAVPPDDFDAAVEQVVQRLATRSVDAIAAVKRMVVQTRDEDVDTGVETERRIFAEYFRSSHDGAEGLAAFREKRPPQFRPPRIQEVRP